MGGNGRRWGHCGAAITKNRKYVKRQKKFFLHLKMLLNCQKGTFFKNFWIWGGGSRFDRGEGGGDKKFCVCGIPPP